MKRFLVSFIALGCVAAGYAIHGLMTIDRNIEAVQRVVAIKWGDGKYGKAFYGTEVYLEPVGSHYSVRGRVWVGRGNNYFHDLGELGTVTTAEEAVVKWGDIQWDQAGLIIGPGDPNPVVVPRAKVEEHR